MAEEAEKKVNKQKVHNFVDFLLLINTQRAVVSKIDFDRYAEKEGLNDEEKEMAVGYLKENNVLVGCCAGR
jgi:hypothetical protein